MTDVLDYMIEDVSKSSDKPCVIYYRSENTEITHGIIEKLQEDTGSLIEVCYSWQSLITQLSVIASINTCVPSILVDISLFSQGDATVIEIVSMLSTLHRCLSNPAKMNLAVVVEKSCDISIMKSLQGTDVMGIIPCVAYFGYKRTLNALGSILNNRQHWPKDLIDIITGVAPESKIIKSTGVTLTERQTQVLNLVCNRGLSNKKIAQALKISESTVKIHVSAILKEYGVRNRTQLVLAASSALRP